LHLKNMIDVTNFNLITPNWGYTYKKNLISEKVKFTFMSKVDELCLCKICLEHIKIYLDFF